MAGGKNLPSKKDAANDIDAFLKKVAETPARAGGGTRGRLMFAMDATASREPTWDRAAHLQGEMFEATRDLGGLEVQLAFFRGFGEFKVSKWTANTDELLRLMTSVRCLAGQTRLSKVLGHAVNTAKERRVNAVVYVGDAFEEDIDDAGCRAGELGLLGVPVFMFQEGVDPIVDFAFRQIARLSGGAYCRLDGSSAETLKRLLGAVAVFAAGGRRALENHAKAQGGDVLRIVHQIGGK